MNDYTYKNDDLKKLCKDEGWPNDWIETLKELLELNNNHIDASILRAHFAISWARCKRLSDSLIDAKFAEPFSEKMTKQNLTKEKRKGGWIK